MVYKKHTFPLPLIVPEYLIGEVKAKLAYVDENIVSGQVSEKGDAITLILRDELTSSQIGALESKQPRLRSKSSRALSNPGFKFWRIIWIVKSHAKSIRWSNL